MHEGQYQIDEALASALISEQFPQFGNLPVRRVDSSGTVNAIFRIGEDLAARFPLTSEYAEFLSVETRWLPKIGPTLPLETPLPVGIGQPSHRFPEGWAVGRWVEGETGCVENLVSLHDAAVQLGAFVAALQGTALSGEEPVGHRSRPLATGDEAVRGAMTEVRDEFDISALTSVWETALGIPDWRHPPVWHHGDLHPGNMVSREGNLVGVLDFGLVGVGDPAVDAIPAWWLFANGSRDIYREVAGFDVVTWERGRGWALAIALIALPYYRETNLVFADMARTAIRKVLADS